MPCAVCGHGGSDDLCAYHPRERANRWLLQNRAFCDFIHRRIEFVGRIPPDPGEMPLPAEVD